MKRWITIVTLLVVYATTAFAGEAGTLADRAALVAELERTEAKFLNSIEGLTEAQWTFKAAPDRWSIAECAEHIAASESFIRGMISGAMDKTLDPAAVGAAHKDEMIKTGLVDRSQKFKAPEPLIPTDRFGSAAAAVDSFRKERAGTIALAKKDVDLRTRGADHFAFGPLDAYGWFLFLSGHSERHTLQIEEVKASPNYPK